MIKENISPVLCGQTVEQWVLSNRIERQAGFMEIRFSHHAKRRAKLYKIPEQTILKVLEGKELNQKNQAIIENVEGFKYPLKIVVAVENDIITVVTNYPLKKGIKG